MYDLMSKRQGRANNLDVMWVANVRETPSSVGRGIKQVGKSKEEVVPSSYFRNINELERRKVWIGADGDFEDFCINNQGPPRRKISSRVIRAQPELACEGPKMTIHLNVDLPRRQVYRKGVLAMNNKKTKTPDPFPTAKLPRVSNQASHPDPLPHAWEPCARIPFIHAPLGRPFHS